MAGARYHDYSRGGAREHPRHQQSCEEKVTDVTDAYRSLDALLGPGPRHLDEAGVANERIDAVRIEAIGELRDTRERREVELRELGVASGMRLAGAGNSGLAGRGLAACEDDARARAGERSRGPFADS